MAAAKVLTRDAWNVRAEQLAEAKGTRGTARYLDECEHGRGHMYRVPSRSSTGSYDVVAWGDGRIECPCKSGAWGKPCSHSGAVVHAERMRTSTGEGDCAWSWWMAGGEW